MLKIAPVTIDEIPPSFWYELKHLISVTPSDYEQLYVKPLQAFCQHLKTTTTNDKAILIKSILTLIITALKIRRAHMLPVGTDAETCYQQQDAWTYALFTAILFRKFLQTNQDVLLQVAQWLPAAGIEWLKQYPTLFSEWQVCLAGNFANNSLNRIIHQAEDSLGATQTNNAPADNNQPVKIATASIKPASSLAETFIAWLKRAIERRQLEVNTEQALVHRVEQGILLKLPDIYQKFIHINKSVKALLQDKSEKEAIELLTQDNHFIPTVAHTGFIHTYYWNEWADRQLIKGLLLESDELFTSDNTPPCNEQLHLEGML